MMVRARTFVGSVAAVACLLIAGVGLTACSGGGERIEATATFDDVADLASGAPVMMSDIPVGSVRSISLDPSGRRATVVIGVDRSAQVPADVTAQVRRTTPLGERFIDLAISGSDGSGPLLADGATIAQTAVVSDLEQLIASGTDAFGALSASQLAILIDEGDRAFGGKGPQLRAVVADLATLAEGYRSRTGEIVDIIDALGELAGDLAPAADANGEALGQLRAAFGILAENDGEFAALVVALSELAEAGDRVLERHLEQISAQIRGLRDVTDAVASQDAALRGVLRNLPRHNENVPLAERNNFVHVLLDIVLCGIPGGGDVPGDPVDDCYPGDRRSPR
jgi:phospholipid/cholesterol/gamma-HCH transport system substrate-binding protein